MADDWQVGDLALRVEVVSARSHFRVGAIYTVSNVKIRPNRIDGTEGYGLRFACGTVGVSGNPWLDARAFRKIAPHTPDAEDQETIALLNGQPVPMEA